MKSHANHYQMLANNSTIFLRRVTLATNRFQTPVLAPVTATINDTRQYHRCSTIDLYANCTDKALTPGLMRSLKSKHFTYNNQLVTSRHQPGFTY